MYVILAQTMNTLVYLCTIPIRWGEECNVINVQMYVVPSNSLQLLSTVKVKMCENFCVDCEKCIEQTATPVFRKICWCCVKRFMVCFFCNTTCERSSERGVEN